MPSGYMAREEAIAAYDKQLVAYLEEHPGIVHWRHKPEVIYDVDSGSYRVFSRLVTVPEKVAAPKKIRNEGWRAAKGPQDSNRTGFRATGHRLLLEPEPVETATESGIILTKKVVDQDKSKGVWLTVVEIGYDAWSDKSTDYCDVGDKVLVGEYTGKFHTSPIDGKEYRFVNDLDIITPLVVFD